LRRDEKNVDYYLLKASLFVDENKIDTAILQYEKIIEQYPDHYLAYSKLGEIYGKIRSDYEKANKYLELAYARNNQHLNTVENLGIVYGIMGKIDLSIKYLLEAEQIEPNNPRVLGNISTTYKMQGNAEKSLEYQKKAEEILKSQGKI
jgi:tetratricopeptide (TPR) repeat protein